MTKSPVGPLSSDECIMQGEYQWGAVMTPNIIIDFSDVRSGGSPHTSGPLWHLWSQWWPAPVKKCSSHCRDDATPKIDILLGSSALSVCTVWLTFPNETDRTLPQERVIMGQRDSLEQCHLDQAWSTDQRDKPLNLYWTTVSQHSVVTVLLH